MRVSVGVCKLQASNCCGTGFYNYFEATPLDGRSIPRVSQRDEFSSINKSVSLTDLATSTSSLVLVVASRIREFVDNLPRLTEQEVISNGYKGM